MKSTLKYLQYYHDKYKFEFHTRLNNMGRHKWIRFNSKEYKELYEDHSIISPNHREVLPCEVVIDVDEKKHFESHRKELQRILDLKKLNYSLWDSGNNGTHAHLFYEGLDKFTLEDRRVLKELIIKHVCGEDFIKKAKVDLQLCGRHMIRAEYGTHERTHYCKTIVKSNNHLRTNKIPEEVIEKFKVVKERMKNWKPVEKLEFNGGKMKCIQFFLSDDFVACKDGRKNAMFALASYFKGKGDRNEQIYEKLTHWNHYKLHDHLKNGSIMSTIKSTKGTMTCRGFCNVLKMVGKEKDVCKGCYLSVRKVQ